MQKIIDKYITTKDANLLDELFEQYSFDEIVCYLNEKEKQNEKDVNYILDYLKYLNNDVYGKYLNNKEKDEEIVQIIKLINSIDKDKLTKFVNLSFSKNQFENIVEKFKKLFPKKNKDLNYIISLYKKYEKMEEEIYNDKLIMLDIFETNYCIEEYCSLTGYSIIKINQIFINLWNTKNSKYQNIIKYIRKRSKDEFYKKVNDIAKYIYLKEDFDIFDYYKCTKMEMKQFARVVDEAVENQEIKQKVIIKINSLFSKFIIRDTMMVCEKTEFSIITKINGKEITNEEKKKILEYMKFNRMHKYHLIYRECLLKYSTGELDLEKMQYIKK